MKTRLFLLLLSSLQLLSPLRANAQEERPSVIGDVLRGLAQSLLQKQQGKVRPVPPPQGYGQPGRNYGPRVLNVSDTEGNSSSIVQGQVFVVVGEGFGHSEGQVAILPDGSDDWIMLRSRSIQRWTDDAITLIISEPLFAERRTNVSVAVVTAEGRSNAISGVLYQSSGGGRPLPPIPSTRPGYDDGYPQGYAGEAPEITPWSVAAIDGDVNESPKATYTAQTLMSLGGPVAKGNAGSNTRYWAGSTIGLLTMGTPSSPPWHHFVIGIAGGNANAARIAHTVAVAASRGDRLRATGTPPPAGGFPSLVVSGERLPSDERVTDAEDERNEADRDARLLREALRLALPPEAGRLRLGTIDELGRSDWGDARSVVKSMSGEGKHMTVLAFLSRTTEPYRRRDGRTDWRCARSLRVAVLGNGPHTYDHCNRVLEGW